ncbi:hypothetical protein [Rosistilla oblonga]
MNSDSKESAFEQDGNDQMIADGGKLGETREPQGASREFWLG